MHSIQDGMCVYHAFYGRCNSLLEKALIAKMIKNLLSLSLELRSFLRSTDRCSEWTKRAYNNNSIIAHLVIYTPSARQQLIWNIFFLITQIPILPILHCVSAIIFRYRHHRLVLYF